MNTYYTKEQMDSLALVIGTRIKENSSASSNLVEEFSSFIIALDSAINGDNNDQIL